VAPNKVFGPDGETNPFRIMTHSEDRSGASVQSILPANYLTTTLELDSGRKRYFSTRLYQLTMILMTGHAGRNYALNLLAI